MIEKTFVFEIKKKKQEFDYSVSAFNINEGRQDCLRTFKDIFDWNLEPSEVIFKGEFDNG
jgi:hypothetical protein